MTRDRCYRRAIACGALAALSVVGCTRPGNPPGPTSTTRPTTTTTAGHGGHGHEVPDHLNHPPTEAQKTAALKWVDDTRAAVKAQGLADLRGAALTKKFEELHYIPIGDYMHWVKPEFTVDEHFLDPTHVEVFTVTGGKITAAMFVYNPKGEQTTMADVPDIAGNWTQWHGHRLPYASNDPTSDDYHKLKFFPPNFVRDDQPMIHVWLEPNRCGPWASAGVGEGSCIAELASY
jgi:hypothetical protein